MNKQRFTILSLVLFIITLCTVVLLTSCVVTIDPNKPIEKEHRLDVWIEEVAPTCTVSGIKGHYTCPDCGKNFDINKIETDDLTIPSVGHLWDDGVVSEAATETSTGVMTYICTRCGATKTEVIPATGIHTYGSWMAEIPATCTEPGVKGHYTCSDCGKYFDINKKEISDLTIPALGHLWNNGVITKPATSTETGIITYTCVRCGATRNETIPKIGSECIHNYTYSYKKYPTCTESGIIIGTCSICGTTIEFDVDALGHNITKWTISKYPTCTEMGEQVGTCGRCGAKEYVSISALGHDFTDWVVTKEPTCTATGTKRANCNRCGISMTDTIEKLDHDITNWTTTKEPTCTEDGIETGACNRCGATSTRSIDALGHDITNWVITKEPTCNEAGIESGVCNRCGITMTRTVETLEHDITDWEVVKDPTCTKEGIKRGKCRNCGVTKTAPISALGHDILHWYIVKEPTCVEQGICFARCERCGETFTRTISTIPHDIIDWTIVQEPTCTEYGRMVGHCSYCGKEFEELIDPLGHSVWEWTTTKEPTCTEWGIRTGRCVRCNKIITERIAPLGHHFTDWEVIKQPTCIYSGLKKGTCSRCGAVTTRTISPLGHNFGHWTTILEPTCTTRGKEVGECLRCGVTTLRYIAKKGHTFSAWVTVKAPTCFQIGRAERICSVCGCKESKILYPEHKWGAWHTEREATCERIGIEVRYCNVCGVKEVREIAPSHKWGSWQTVKTATCLENGKMQRTCLRCGKVETSITPKTDHSFVLTFKKDATCTAGGYKKYTCSVCGAKKQENFSALGHSYHYDYNETLHWEVCSRCGIESSRFAHSFYEDIEDVKTQNSHEYRRITRHICFMCGYSKVVKEELVIIEDPEYPPCPHVHNYNRKNTSPYYLKSSATCTRPAVYYYSCVCGKKGTATFTYGAALGHLWSAYVVTKEPTCTEPGIRTCTCQRCGETMIDSISVLGHNLISWSTPTLGNCEDPVIVAICTRCGYRVEDPAPGHLWDDGVVTKAPTATKTGIMTYTCQRCGTRKTETIPATGSGYSKGLEFTSNGDGTCYVSGIGTCTDLDIIIPSVSPDGDTVIAIGESFEGKAWAAVVGIEYGFGVFKTEIKSINIPSSVKFIYEFAFIADSLETVSFAENSQLVYIGYDAFRECKFLRSICIPSSVTSIGIYAFGGCSSLTSITVAEGNTVYHSAGNCLIETASKTLIAGCKNSVIPTDGSVTSIGDYAFGGCSSLTSIEIPEGVTSIGSSAFSGCDNLQYNIYGNANYLGNSSNPYFALIKAKNTSITSCEIHNQTKIIADSAFYGCSSLTSIKIPEGVTSIGSYAFCGCNSLTSIKIPASVTSIGDDAFSDCSSLTSIEIPASVTSIGSYAFYGCSSLTSIEIPASVKRIGNQAFSCCSSLSSITVVKGNTVYHSAGNCLIKTASKTLIAGCKNSIIPTDGSVTSIGYSAFYGCSALTSIDIPASVTSIGNGAFDECRSLTSITFAENSQLTSIELGAFSGCRSLTSINYSGTKAQWNAISKGNYWNYNTGNYTVYCTDGNIAK